MRKRSGIFPFILVVAGCASPVQVAQVSASADSAVHRLICREKLDCPQQAAQLCPGGYRVVDGAPGVIGSLNDMRVACI
jgi:hypothetical protein